MKTASHVLLAHDHVCSPDALSFLQLFYKEARQEVLNQTRQDRILSVLFKKEMHKPLENVWSVKHVLRLINGFICIPEFVWIQFSLSVFYQKRWEHGHGGGELQTLHQLIRKYWKCSNVCQCSSSFENLWKTFGSYYGSSGIQFRKQAFIISFCPVTIMQRFVSVLPKYLLTDCHAVEQIIS